MPVALAIERVDQCVASLGVSSSVLTITRSTSLSWIVRGLPGRGSSCSPSSRCSAKRLRHLPTVVRLHPSRAAMSLFDSPDAAAHDAAPKCQRLRALWPTRPAFQRLALFVGEQHLWSRSSSQSHLSLIHISEPTRL